MADCSSEVRSIIARELGLDEKEVTTGALFGKDLGADSPDFLEIVVELEKHFDIAISDEEVEKLITVGLLIDHVNKKVA